MPSLETKRQVYAAAAAAEDKKAEDIRILALDPSESSLTDYFLICNGTNDRQNVAIGDEIEARMKSEFGMYANSVEGRRQGEWILMDYVDFVVHIFSPEKREYYGLERLRKSAKLVSMNDLDAELNNRVKAARIATPAPVAATKKKTVAKNKAVAKKPFKKIVAKKAATKKIVKKVAPKKKATTKKLVKKSAAKRIVKKTAAKKVATKKKVVTKKATAKKPVKKAVAKKKAAKKKKK
jgi:ribosome-associated protein